MLLNNSGTKNARETRFVPESSWHVTASEFQSFRAASILLDNENDQVGGCAPKLTQQASLWDFCTQRKSQVTTGQFDPKYLLNLNKFSTIG
jgi:hypothetical protein